MTTLPAPSRLLLTIAEPTRIRLVNCLAAAPLCVSDLQAILDLPQPTVSRHLTILRQAGVVHDTPVGPFVLYRLPQENTASRRLLDAALDALTREGEMKAERRRALDRHRSHTRFQIPQGALPA